MSKGKLCRVSSLMSTLFRRSEIARTVSVHIKQKLTTQAIVLRSCIAANPLMDPCRCLFFVCVNRAMDMRICALDHWKLHFQMAWYADLGSNLMHCLANSTSLRSGARSMYLDTSCVLISTISFFLWRLKTTIFYLLQTLDDMYL